jgi:hypothetical protein
VRPGPWSSWRCRRRPASGPPRGRSSRSSLQSGSGPWCGYAVPLRGPVRAGPPTLRSALHPDHQPADPQLQSAPARPGRRRGQVQRPGLSPTPTSADPAEEQGEAVRRSRRLLLAYGWPTRRRADVAGHQGLHH